LREYKAAEDIIVSAELPILDAGAHVGFFSLYSRVLNPKVLIYALEPLAENLEVLNKHLKDNKVKKVKVVEAALAGATEQRKLVVTNRSHNNYLGISGEREVQAYSFHDFCEENQIERVSLLKMDIEGGEYELIDSLTVEDFSRISAVILEYHNVEHNSRVIEEKLRESGFGVQIFPSKFDKTMGFIFAVNKR
jgi:FkbM family methyltransferase